MTDTVNQVRLLGRGSASSLVLFIKRQIDCGLSRDAVEVGHDMVGVPVLSRYRVRMKRLLNLDLCLAPVVQPLAVELSACCEALNEGRQVYAVAVRSCATWKLPWRHIILNEL